MNKILSTLSVLAVVFALVLGTVQAARATGDDLRIIQTGETNLFAMDGAHNAVLGAPDRDIAPVVNFESYGLDGYRVSTQ